MKQSLSFPVVVLFSTLGAIAQTQNITVDAKSNIFAAGRVTAFDGMLPPSVTLAAGTGRIITFSNASGTVRCSSGSGVTGPDGGTECSTSGTDLNSYRGISGIINTRRTMFLVGVFLTNSEPADPAPVRLDFSNNEHFTSLSPLIGQTFFIGDGLTATGTRQQFVAPDSATRLYLGLADGYALHGAPGFYADNSGSFTIGVNAAGGATSCSYSITPSSLSVAATSGNGSIAVSTAAGCVWTATSNASWISILTGSSGNGPGSVSISIAANTGAGRAGTITIAGLTFTVVQAAAGTSCSYAIQPASQSIAAVGGALSVQVSAGPSCAWTAVSNATWLSITSGASGSGNGTVNMSVSANAGTARTGSATIAGLTAIVNQASVSDTSTVEIIDVVNDADFTANLAQGSAVVIRGRNIASTTRVVDAGLPWPNQLDGLTVEVLDGDRILTAPIGGVSSSWVWAQLPFGISSNITIRLLTQAGRSNSKSIAVLARNPRLYSNDGTGQGPVWALHADYSEVTASAPARPGEEILILGTGLGAVTPAVAAGQLGLDPRLGFEPNRVSDTVEILLQGIIVRPRLAILDFDLVGVYSVYFTVPESITVATPTLQIRVGGVSSQTNVTLPSLPGACSYSLSTTSLQFAAAGGSFNINVTTNSSCSWTATSNQSWLTVSAGASGTGNGVVTLTAAANTGSSRTATATIAGRSVAVTQAAASAVCTYAVDPTGFSVYHLAYRDSFRIVTGAGCSWAATSEAAWLSITSASSGTGPATMTFEVSANPAMTERTGRIQIGTATFTIRQMGALATFEVDAKANIFAAGRTTAFSGLLPPGYRFSAGSGKVLTIDTANGATHCQSGTPSIPADGTTFCVSSVTNVLSYQGIGGIVHGRKVMFLVGVFLDDREPADPAPTRLDFTDNENYTTISPSIGQVFFLGDGRTSSNAQQTVVVPETATRLFLGFADANGFQGIPGAYQDNTGGLTVGLRVAAGVTPPPPGGTSLTVDARSNIFASGRATAFDGLLPPSINLTAGVGRVATFSAATGTVRCSSSTPATGPDGGTECSSNGTDINSYRGVSGLIHTRKTMFLVGVFLGATEPADPSPTRLDFSSNDSFSTLSPAIGQSFFVGDGLTATGATQQFVVPDAATRLYLGFADGFAVHGNPGYYGDNSGSLGITVQVAGGGSSCNYVVSPLSISALANGGASTISISTSTGCTWSVTSNASWITLTSAASGSGNATVQINVAANTGVARTGQLNIAGQTITVSQAAGGSTSCTYSIVPGSAQFIAAGGPGAIEIVTQSGCSWTGSTTASWITFPSGQTGNGSGTLRYSVAANPGVSSRLGTISVGGKNHPVEQAGNVPPSVVTISSGGVVDAASFSTALAPGSLFTIFGTNLANATNQASSLPLPTTFEGVTVEVIDGTTTTKAPLFFVSPGQVNGQLPFDLKNSSVQIRVRNSKGDSDPVSIELSSRAPRLFPWNETNAIVVHSDYRLVTDKAPAQPGEYLIVFLVGMGEVSPSVPPGAAAGDGTSAPLNLLTESTSVLVGGRPTSVVFAGMAPYFVGLYQVNFQMPAAVLSGPVDIQVLVGRSSSQNGLTLFAGSVFSNSTVQNVGAAGGVVSGGGLSVAIPAGALAATATLELSQTTAPASMAGQLPDVWKLSGIPREIRMPIQVTYRPSGAALKERVFLVVRTPDGKGDMRLPATLKDGAWTATLPPRTGRPDFGTTSAIQSLSEAVAPSDDDFESALLLWAHGYTVYTDPSDRFQIIVHPDEGENEFWASLKSDVVSQALNDAWLSMVNMGFAPYLNRIWPGNEPVIVWLQKKSTFPNSFKGTSVAPWLWGKWYTLIVDADELAAALRVGDEIEIAEDALLLFLQVVHEPLVSVYPAWKWWLVALAIASDDNLSCVVTASPDSQFWKAMLGYGLELGPDKSQPSIDVGLGAFSFIQFLMAETQPTLPSEVLTQAEFVSASKPSDVLKTRLASPGLGAWWQRFIAKFGLARASNKCSYLEGAPPQSDNGFTPKWLEQLVGIAEKGTATPTGFVKELNLFDLSARPMLITLPPSSEVEEEMFLSLNTSDAEVKFLAASLDSENKVLSDWLVTGSSRVRIPWEWRMGNQLWLWVVQTRFGQAGRRTAVRVNLELAPKTTPPPSVMPWPAPGPTNLNFDSAVPMRRTTGLDRTMIQVWSSDYANSTLSWNYPTFKLVAPSKFYQDTDLSLNTSGTVDSARKLLEISIDAKRANGETQYNRVRITLRNLPCTYREDGAFYFYNCGVSGDQLRSNFLNYVSSFTDENWLYKFNPTPGTGGKWELQSTATPEYDSITPGAAGLAVEFRGRL